MNRLCRITNGYQTVDGMAADKVRIIRLIGNKLGYKRYQTKTIREAISKMNYIILLQIFGG